MPYVLKCSVLTTCFRKFQFWEDLYIQKKIINTLKKNSCRNDKNKHYYLVNIISKKASLTFTKLKKKIIFLALHYIPQYVLHN